MNSLRKTLLATLSTTCILLASCTDVDSSADQAMVTETSTETFTETATASAESMEEARAEDAAENPAEVNANEHSGRGNGTVLPGTLRRTLPTCSGSTSRSATSTRGSGGCGGESRDERAPGGAGARRCSCCSTGDTQRRNVFPKLRGRSCSRCRSPARRRSRLSLTARPRQGRRSLRITRCAITLCRRFYRRPSRRRRPCHTRRQACIRQSLAADPKR